MRRRRSGRSAGPSATRCYAVVNYDGFELDSDLEDAYLDAVQEMSDTYFHGVTRFTTSAFMRVQARQRARITRRRAAHLRIRRRSRRRRTHHRATPGVTEVPPAGPATPGHHGRTTGPDLPDDPGRPRSLSPGTSTRRSGRVTLPGIGSTTGGIGMTTTVTELAQDIGLARETDYYLMKDQLTEDELGLLYKVRQFAETEILPVASSYWERDEFPFELVPKLAGLNIVGDTMAGYGTTPMSAVGAGLLMYEVSRVDGSLGDVPRRARRGWRCSRSTCSARRSRSSAGCRRWPGWRRSGRSRSPSPTRVRRRSLLETTARRDGGEWVLNGRKRWIGNAVWCDVIVVCARDTTTGRSGVRGREGQPRLRRVQDRPARWRCGWCRTRTSR